MKYDAIQKANVEIIENNYVINQVAPKSTDEPETKKKHRKIISKLDVLSSMIVVVAVGTAASLGYLIINIIKALQAVGSSVMGTLSAML